MASLAGPDAGDTQEASQTTEAALEEIDTGSVQRPAEAVVASWKGPESQGFDAVARLEKIQSQKGEALAAGDFLLASRLCKDELVLLAEMGSAETSSVRFAGTPVARVKAPELQGIQPGGCATASGPATLESFNLPGMLKKRSISEASPQPARDLVSQAKKRIVHWRLAAGKHAASKSKREKFGKQRRKATLCIDVESIMGGTPIAKSKNSEKGKSTRAKLGADTAAQRKRVRRADGKLYRGRQIGSKEPL